MILLVGFLIALLTFITCAPEKPLAPAAGKEAKIKAPVAKEKESWEAEWEKTLKEAKKQGRLILYSTTNPPVRQALSEGFKKRTGLEIDIIAGRGPDIAAKLFTERNAGLYLADFFLGGTTDLILALKPKGFLNPIMPELFLPEVLDAKLWYKGALPFMDKEKLIMQTRYMPGGSQMDAAFNPDQVNKSELVSWYDLLKPKFKGKMVMLEPIGAGKTSTWVNDALTYYGLDWDYIRALAKQEPLLVYDKRQPIEWVARGKALVAILPSSTIVRDFKEAGANLDFVVLKESKDVLGGGSSGIGLIADPPHPEARKLFLNWFLSREGQTIFSYAYHIQSAREDTPTDHLPEWQVRKPNVDYPIETEEFILQKDKFLPKVKEIFGPLIK